MVLSSGGNKMVCCRKVCWLGTLVLQPNYFSHIIIIPWSNNTSEKLQSAFSTARTNTICINCGSHHHHVQLLICVYQLKAQIFCWSLGHVLFVYKLPIQKTNFKIMCGTSYKILFPFKFWRVLTYRIQFKIRNL